MIRLIAATFLFLLHPSSTRGFLFVRDHNRKPSFVSVSRYGPSEIPGDEISGDVQSEAQMDEVKRAFRNLIEEAKATSNPEHLPRVLANNMELMMSMTGEDGTQVISEVLQEAEAAGKEELQRTATVIETVMSFAEDFVEQAVQMDDQNKKLLGKILKAMASKEDPARDKEEYLDELMEEEKDNFTPGFLRHLEGECERIAGARKVTPEGARLLEIIRIIQTRVLEELGKEMGEAAVVLGQLMGYEDEGELLGVLEAGLTVRGRDFAVEMASLTEEALGGFKRVPGIDIELVERVTFIDNRVRKFLDDTNKFQ